MRILLVSRRFSREVQDGMTRYAWHLGRRLAESGHVVSVLCGPTEDGWVGVERNTPEGFTAIHRHVLPETLKHNPPLWRRFAGLVATIARTHSPDVIVLQHPYHAAGAFQVRKTTRIPIIYICHTITALDPVFRRSDQRYMHDLANERLESDALNGSDAVICVSGALRRSVKRFYQVPDSRLHVIPTGVTFAELSARPPTLVRTLERLRASGHIVALYAGRDAWEKGTDLLPQIIQRAAGAAENVTFVLAGLNRDSWARYLLTPRTFTLPWLMEEDLEWVYRCCDVLILPSRRDSMPYVLLESMLHGIIPVVGNTDGPGGLITHGVNGLKVPVTMQLGQVRLDASAMATEIARLAADPHMRRALSHAAREKIRTHHSPESQVRAFVRLAQRCSSERNHCSVHGSPISRGRRTAPLSRSAHSSASSQGRK